MRFPADHARDPSFERAPQQHAQFDALLQNADALYGAPDTDPHELQRAVRSDPGLRWVHLMAAGGGAEVRAADLTPHQLQQVQFTTSAGVHGGPLAEFALFGLLNGAKNLPRLQDDQSSREWPERWLMGQLTQQTVLVLGLGGIGKALIERLAIFGVRILGFSRHGRPVPGVTQLVQREELGNAASHVNAVVITLPETDATRDLVSAEFLAKVRPGTTIVNVGRGSVVDAGA